MSDESTEVPRRPFTSGPLSARSDPAWLNQATVKGAILVLAGGAMMVATPKQQTHVTLILGLLLIGWSLAELWFRVVRSAAPVGAASVGFPAVLLAGGAALILDPGPALSVIIGVTLVIRAIVLLLGRLTGSLEPGASVWRALLLLVVGVIIIVLPEAFILGIRALAGGLSVLVGAILVGVGLGPDDEQEIFDLDASGTGRLAEDWLRDQRLESEQVDEISETLFFEPPRRGDKLASFWVMMCLATAIATFAVIQDSTAVVIGAMLVAPLMTPIIGIAAGIVNGWSARMAASLVLVAAAVAVSILLAWIIAAWLPTVGDVATNGQITSRTSPNILDLCIAVAAGAAGAYATVDPRVSSSLSGVAIAVALVPPLAVVGITLEAGMTDDAVGAFLLFLTNFVSIILAGSLVLVLTGYARFPRTKTDTEQQWRIMGPVLVGATLIVVPLSLTSFSIWDDSTNTAAAEDVIDEWLGDQVDVSPVQLTVEDNDVELVLTGSDATPPVAELEAALDEAFGEEVDLGVRMVPSEILSR